MGAPGKGTAVVIPIFRPDHRVTAMVGAIKSQSIDLLTIVLDSSPRREPRQIDLESVVDRYVVLDGFDHGSARNTGARLARESGAHTVVFLTQDCVLATPDSLAALTAPLRGRDKVGATTGRQLPHAGAGPLAVASRLVMYPSTARERAALGLYATSNAFAAYDLQAIEEVGGFPEPCVFGEDAVASDRLIDAGWRVVYVPGATAHHSHDYTIWEEFRRQFDAGAARAVAAASPKVHRRVKARQLLRAELQAVSRLGSASTRLLWVGHVAARLSGFACGLAVRLLPRAVSSRLSASPHILDRVLSG